MTNYVMQIMWHINNECNFTCRHCYNNEQKKHPVDRLDFQQSVIKRIADLQSHYRIIRVGLLGGEPFIDPNIIRVIELLHSQGIKRIDISTNGSLITPDLARRLKEVNVGMVQVSLEGPTAVINDVVRGNGSFDKALKGLRLLREAGIDTGIMTTVSQFNLPYIEKMVELATKEGNKIIAFNRMLPIGRGETEGLHCLTSNDLYLMMALIHQLSREYHGKLDISSDDPLLYIPTDQDSFTENNYGGCGAGIGSIAINHDGSVFPCRRLPINIGNLANDSLIGIINSSRLDCFYNRKFLRGECGVCDYRQICGGCRAAAYAFTGDYLNEDPQCWKISKKGGLQNGSAEQRASRLQVK